MAQIHEILLGDPDADGDLEVVALNTAPNDMSFWANNGDGTFEVQVRFGVEEHPFDFSYADFTGDGIADLAVTGQRDSSDTPSREVRQPPNMIHMSVTQRYTLEQQLVHIA